MKLTPAQEQRFWAKVDRRGADECWPWTGAKSSSSRNYGTFWVGTTRANGRLHRATKISVFLATGQLPGAGELLLHSCDNPPCVNPAHLRIGTQSENLRECVSKRRHKAIAQQENTSAKLTADDVHELRTAYRMGVGCRRLLSIYPIESRSLRKIIHGKSWIAHV